MKRRDFIRTSAAIGLGTLWNETELKGEKPVTVRQVKIGIIGLDTSHSPAFAKLLNENADPAYNGFYISAAYPYGSRTIPSSAERIPGYQKEFEKMGITITNTLDELIHTSDAILLETCDGRLHLEQAIPVIRAGKPLFIDKPVAASLADTIAIYEFARIHNVPVFSSSSLRFMHTVYEVKEGKVGTVVGADVYSPAYLEETHPDLFWYAVHGVETLYSILGTGCLSVARTSSGDTEFCVGVWEDGRIGTFRGTRSGKSEYGGYVYGDKACMHIGPFEGYKPLLDEIITFFKTGIVPVKPAETIEIFAFMTAADISKAKSGCPVLLREVMEKANKEAEIKIKSLT